MKSQRMSWVLLKNRVNIGKSLKRKILTNQANSSLNSHLKKRCNNMSGCLSEPSGIGKPSKYLVQSSSEEIQQSVTESHQTPLKPFSS